MREVKQLPIQDPSLEEFIARLNAQAFWQEFTFSRNTFTPSPGIELELADNLVWLDDFAFILQLKQRKSVGEDSNSERSWFEKKVVKKATRQIRDTLRFLSNHQEIRITNARGQAFTIRGNALTDITKIVIFLAGSSLPIECQQVRHHVSSTAGFIHLVSAQDYLHILETLRIPKDIRDYFSYRENALRRLQNASIDETDIIGGFISDEQLPTSGSHKRVEVFIQDIEAFDLSYLLRNLHDHIDKVDQPLEYLRIMLEFARVPRSVWREIRTRFLLCFEAAKKGEFILPFRLSFPDTSCTFMIGALDPNLPASGLDGQRMRLNGLRSFTHGAKYDARTSKGIGILLSRDGAYYQIDWMLIDQPWQSDPEMEAWLAKANPFRPTQEKMINSFLFSAENRPREK